MYNIFIRPPPKKKNTIVKLIISLFHSKFEKENRKGFEAIDY